MYRIGFFFVLVLLASCSQVSPSQAGVDADTPLTVNANGVKGRGEQIAVSQRLGAVFVVGDTNGPLAGEYSGENDAFLRRYDRSGKIVWQRQIGGSADDTASGIALDQNNNIYAVTRKCKIYTDIPCNGNLYKFNAKGKQLWVRRFSSYDDVFVRGVITDTNNDVYVTGSVSTGDYTKVTVFLRKYNGNGNFVFEKSFDAADIDEDPTAITTDGANNVYIATRVGTDEDYTPSFLYKYTSSGKRLWQKDIPGDTALSDLQVVGDVLYGGGYKDYYTNGAPRYYLETDAYIAKYDLRGNRKWSKSFGTRQFDSVNGISVDTEGNIYVSGDTFGSLNGQNKGKYDAFVRKYAPNGNVVWTKQLGTVNYDSGADIVAYGTNELYLTGSTDGIFDNSTYNSGVLTVRLDGTGQTVWLDQ